MGFLKISVILGCCLILGAFSEDCSNGESYWCRNLKNAKQCSAFNHCKQNAWKNEVVAVDSSETCLFCETVIKEVFEYLQQKKSEQFIESFLDKICDLIPSKEKSYNCKIYVKEALPMILELIKEKTDPKVVCKLLGLCDDLLGKDEMSDVHHFKNEFVAGDNSDIHYIETGDEQLEGELDVDGVLCEECMNFTTQVRDMFLSEKTEKKVISFVEENLCKAFIIGEDECKRITEKFVPEFFQTLRKAYDPKKICAIFCKRIGFLTEEAALLQRAVMSYKKSAEENLFGECEVCKLVFTELKSFLQSESNQKKIESFVKKEICPLFKSHEKDCDEYVDSYSDMVFSFIVSELDATTVCHSLGLCPYEVTMIDNAPVETAAPLEKAVPLVKATPIEKAVLLTKEEIEREVNSIFNIRCSLCKKVVDEAEKLIDGKKTEERVFAALEKVCHKLPIIGNACESFVKVFAKPLVDLILQDLSSEMVCEALMLCAPSDSRLEVKCDVCEIVVQYLEALLDQNATISKIEDVVMKVCHLLPSKMKEPCDDLVNEYGVLVIHYIATMKTPKELCNSLNLCNQKKDKLYYKCIAGPQYWCASEANAKMCEAEEHCKKYAWA